jgi:hypothetical protein
VTPLGGGPEQYSYLKLSTPLADEGWTIRALRLRINREAQANIPKERLSSSGDPTLFGTGSSSAGDLGVEGKHQHHDHGLAHGAGIFPIARGVLHLQRQP